MTEKQQRHTYNMGVIGNCAFMAYVDTHADIKWMCWPRFDSSFIFGGLLDQEKGGYFYVRPAAEHYSTKQYYLQNTNVLCTEFDCPDGKFRVTDFAPRFTQYDRYFKPLMLIRKIEPLEGQPEIRVGCKPVGEYGEIMPESYIGSNHIRYLGLDRPLRLTTDFPLSYILDERNIILDRVHHCVLTYGIPLEAPLHATVETFLDKTVEYWRQWVKGATIPPYFQEAVIRSALVLKLHQYEDTGAIIAAGTTSLPEFPGEGRNWDYRFCWMRDSYYTLRAFNNLGHFEELVKYSAYIQNVAGIRGTRNQPLYSITGNQAQTEERILNLSGYKGNQPVRIGNQASEHIQNDIYGQVLVSLLPLYSDMRFVERDRSLALRNTLFLLEKIEETMEEPDAGLWEFRNKSQKHAYTYLFHWAGAHAALKIGKMFGEKTLVTKAEALVKHAVHNIEACYDHEAGIYRQAMDSDNLDASLFQMITMNYLDGDQEKAIKHLRGLEKELQYKKPLMFRYKHKDDFGIPSSTFLVCAFWYIEALAHTGHVDEAMENMEELMKYGNHLMLFSEDVDAKDGSQWGNFPQCYSHVGVINAIFMISTRLNRPEFLVH